MCAPSSKGRHAGLPLPRSFCPPLNIIFGNCCNLCAFAVNHDQLSVHSFRICGHLLNLGIFLKKSSFQISAPSAVNPCLWLLLRETGVASYPRLAHRTEKSPLVLNGIRV